MPTNWDLLCGFIGSVGFLADDILNICLPLGVLSTITGDKVLFRWTPTEQCAFDEAKNLTELAQNHSWRPITYGTDAPQVWLVMDGCLTGISGVVSQGVDWKTAVVATFYLAKLNSTQGNYPVHEIEMLSGVETMVRHWDILQGIHFKWITDHKGLIYLLNQKSVSGCQARWLEKISLFFFEVIYVASSDNVLADALSRLYSNDAPGTICAGSEYTQLDDMDGEPSELMTGMVLLAGIDAVVATHRDSGCWNEHGAETGRPETFQEFAQQMAGRFVLCGPQNRTEGRKGSGKQLHTPLKQQSHVDHDYVDQNKDKEDVNHDRHQSIGANDQSITEPNMATELNSETSLVNVLESDTGVNLLNEIKGHYQDDLIFKSVLDIPKEFRNFEVKDNLIYLKLNRKSLLCIPKVIINGRNIYEIIISEAHSILAHLGANKTLNYLRDHVWWKDMVSDTKSY